MSALGSLQQSGGGWRSHAESAVVAQLSPRLTGRNSVAVQPVAGCSPVSLISTTVVVLSATLVAVAL